MQIRTLALRARHLSLYGRCGVSARNMSIRLFEDKDHASLYAKYRPSYNDAFYTAILKFYETGKGKECNNELAVDVGCGNGQSSRPLCSHFRHVIGYDVSEEQIKSAPKDLKNLTFKVGPGEDLSFLGDNSVDLLTIAQALHWLDRDVFYKEVRRVLKPGGVFAAYGYGNNEPDEPVALAAVQQFYSGLLDGYWDKQRSHIDNKYASIDIPFEDQKRIMDSSIAITREMPVDAYIGYLSTWSGWRAYCKQHPGFRELERMRETLKACYGDRDMKIIWPSFMLLGRKPKH